MQEAVRRELTRRGYIINDEAYGIIEACDDWYRAKATDAHRRRTVNGAHYTLERMGFARRLAADDANMCEVVEINPGEAAYEVVKRVLRENRFDTAYRRQLELTAAEGTAACYVRIEDADVLSDGTLYGGRVRLSYVDALGYAPLAMVCGEVTEAAFWGERMVGGRAVTEMVIAVKNAEGRYVYSECAFDHKGREVDGSRREILLGYVKPFAVLRTANVNTFACMQGFGFPKLYSVIPLLYGLDAAYTALLGDIETAEKITLINELLCSFDEDGRPITPNAEMKRRFVLLGEKLPGQDDLVHEILPAVRISEFRESIEMMMNLAARQFGFGSRRYSLSTTGDMTTATQYSGERHDMLQELNRQRYEAQQYIADIVRAVIWFSNYFQGCDLPLDADVSVEFDDSYITDKAQELAVIRQDVLDGIGGDYVRALYLMKRYNLDEREAKKYLKGSDGDDEGGVPAAVG